MSALFPVAVYVTLVVCIAIIILGVLRVGFWWMDRVEAQVAREFLEQQLVAEAAANAARSQARQRA